MSRRQTSPLIIILSLAVILLGGVLAYLYLNQPDRRSTTDRLGDAIHALPQGVDQATRELEDRTPGERLRDEVKEKLNKE